MANNHPHAEWSGTMFDILRDAGVKLFAHVPDAGNDRLIALADKHNDTRTVLLTTEEEGVAICAGTTRSPSFSRSSSSTRMNMRPLRASAMISSTDERFSE